MNLNDRLFVALDYADADSARKMAGQLYRLARFKIGLELFTATGPELVRAIGAQEVFLDLKFKDIPNTMAGAARSATYLGVRMFSLHCDAGRPAMQAAREAVDERARTLALKQKPLVIGVTVLTSMDQEGMKAACYDPGTSIAFKVGEYARQAYDCGLNGVVCSPLEIEIVRTAVKDPNFQIITPGVRPAGASQNDQKRVMTPGEAIRRGASCLVVGRPITKPEGDKTPRQAAEEILLEMETALGKAA